MEEQIGGCENETKKVIEAVSLSRAEEDPIDEIINRRITNIGNYTSYFHGNNDSNDTGLKRMIGL